MTWREHVLTIRRELRLTQVQLAGELWMTQGIVTGWETGRIKPPRLLTIADMDELVVARGRPDLIWDRLQHPLHLLKFWTLK